MAGHIKPDSVNTMTVEEAAWVGAIIEGEGTIAYRQGKPRAIQVVNTDPEIHSALLRLTGVGKMYGTVRPATGLASKSPRKPCFVWHVGSKLNMISIARQCRRYSTKLQRIEEE